MKVMGLDFGLWGGTKKWTRKCAEEGFTLQPLVAGGGGTCCSAYLPNEEAQANCPLKMPILLGSWRCCISAHPKAQHAPGV